MYDFRKHLKDTTFAATAQTHTLFVEEAKLYACSVGNDWKGLQDFSGRKIRYSYLVYAAEIVALLDQLAKCNNNKIVIPDDKMRDFIRERIDRCQAQLVHDEAFLGLLLRVIRPRLQLDTLVEFANDTTFQAAIASLRGGMEVETQTQALLESFLHLTPANPAAVSKTSATPPTGPKVDQVLASNNVEIAFKALEQERLLLAPITGLGTLHIQSHGQFITGGRNEAFHFDKGEVLVRLDATFKLHCAYKNIVVQNQKGEVGEVYKGLGFRSVQKFIERGTLRIFQGFLKANCQF